MLSVVGWLLGGQWYCQSTRVQVLNLTLLLEFFWSYSTPSSDVHSVAGDVPVDYKGVKGVCGDLR